MTNCDGHKNRPVSVTVGIALSNACMKKIIKCMYEKKQIIFVEQKIMLVKNHPEIIQDQKHDTARIHTLLC